MGENVHLLEPGSYVKTASSVLMKDNNIICEHVNNITFEYMLIRILASAQTSIL